MSAYKPEQQRMELHCFKLGIANLQHQHSKRASSMSADTHAHTAAATQHRKTLLKH